MTVPPGSAVLGFRYEAIRGRGVYASGWHTAMCCMDGEEVLALGASRRLRRTSLLTMAAGPHHIQVFGLEFSPRKVERRLLVERHIDAAPGTCSFVRIVPGQVYGFRRRTSTTGGIYVEPVE